MYNTHASSFAFCPDDVHDIEFVEVYRDERGYELSPHKSVVLETFSIKRSNPIWPHGEPAYSLATRGPSLASSRLRWKENLCMMMPLCAGGRWRLQVRN